METNLKGEIDMGRITADRMFDHVFVKDTILFFSLYAAFCFIGKGRQQRGVI
jgi:hypothetical protein